MTEDGSKFGKTTLYEMKNIDMIVDSELKIDKHACQ